MMPSWLLSTALVRATHYLTRAFLSFIRSVFDQGERRSVDTCNKLGEFTITGVERARKGEPKVRAAVLALCLRSRVLVYIAFFKGVHAPLCPIL